MYEASAEVPMAPLRRGMLSSACSQTLGKSPRPNFFQLCWKNICSCDHQPMSLFTDGGKHSPRLRSRSSGTPAAAFAMTDTIWRTFLSVFRFLFFGLFLPEKISGNRLCIPTNLQPNYFFLKNFPVCKKTSGLSTYFRTFFTFQ